MSHRTKLRPKPEIESLLSPGEVVALFGVHPSTVTRWANAGKLTSVRTLGNHRRFRAAEVRALLAEGYQPVTHPSRQTGLASSAPSHTVGVEDLTPELRTSDPRIPAAALFAVVERGTDGALIKVGTDNLTALRCGYALADAAANYARTVGATYVPAVA